MSRIDLPVVAVTLAGFLMLPCVDCEIVADNRRQAATFRAALAPADDGDAAALWPLLAADAETLSVDIAIGLAGEPALSILQGVVDAIRIDPVRGLVMLEGRDLTARLIDLAVTEGFVNQTGSEIASALAARAGLAAAVIPTATIVGQYYQIEHARSAVSAYTRFATAWDLICHLAQTEGYDCWVADGALQFVPEGSTGTLALEIDLAAIAAGAPDAAPLTGLRLERRSALARGTSVSVVSWESRQRNATAATFPEATDAAAAYVFVAPNLPQAASAARAAALYRDIVRHAQSIVCDMPGAFAPMPRDLVVLAGAPAGFDGTYVVDEIIRRINTRSGFTQSFTAHLT